MKKLLLIGTLILSVGAFAAGQGNNVDGNNNRGRYYHNHNSNCTMMGEKSYKRGNKRHLNLTEAQRKEISKVKIALEEKKLELKKLMLESNVDWSKVEKLNQEMGNISAKLKTDMMKYKYENRQNLINQNNVKNTNNTNN
ncbi:protein refolding chaperone Spy/CpxP family [Cetobacterium ceti]|uniref:Protein refolding chaperone Spy/CpxP family n=1 Tax=Cetobacterium ceti TaxID=180163 RepID=A0A1T4LDJ0_9FUSO|nr:hypothetical protein [Cetobacterium ceti]SJZ52842.1 protein refolding chaperone Spy/CpxP family [Cetobacterium ceti]